MYAYVIEVSGIPMCMRAYIRVRIITYTSIRGTHCYVSVIEGTHL